MGLGSSGQRVCQHHIARKVADIQRTLDDRTRGSGKILGVVAREEMLAFGRACRHPDDISLRSRYAYYCWQCGYPRRAHKQFEQIGDKLWWDNTFTEAKMKQARANAAKHAAVQPKAR